MRLSPSDKAFFRMGLHCGIGTLEIGALEPVPRAFNADERRGHARFRQRPVPRSILDPPLPNGTPSRDTLT
jgi:hypothetical protein